jgi:hypothetical protein
VPLITAKAVFLMIPRTATTWARHAIRNGGITYREVNPKHSPEVLPQNPPISGVPAFKFTFTREPSAWLRSRWTLGKWDDEFSGDWDISFEKFRSNVSDDAIARYFRRYTSQCQFVGKTETIADDLVAALRQAGEDFDETALRDTARCNESPEYGDLYGCALWAMKRDDLGKLPNEMIGRLPVDLIPRLPPDSLGKLPPAILTDLVNRTTRAALQSAGAMTDKR